MSLAALPAGRSKLAHHAVCAVRPIIVGLMNCCHATLAILLFLVQFTALKLFTSLSFLLYEIHLIIDRKATPSDFYKDQLKINK